MSTPQQPGRRRRIAGERRTSRPVTEPTAGSTVPPDATSAPAAPVVVEEGREAPTKKVRKTPRKRRPRPRVESASSGWWGSGRSLAVLGGVLAVLLLVAGALALGLLGNDSVRDVQREKDVEQASRSAAATAERAAAAVLAYDHRSLETSRENAVRFLADDFAKEYTKTFDEVAGPTAERTRAVVTAEVQASSVVRASEDRVRVLLFVDQTTESSSNPTPQLSLNRVEMVMVREGDSWKVEEITSY
jgi:Mce-associated membrane protein